MDALGLPFEVVGSLGQGGLGDVYEVRLPGDPRRLAAKVLRRADPHTVARFEREGQAAARLRHPNIVPVHTAGSLPDGTPYMLLDLVEGESLAEALERGPLTVPRVVELGIALGEALVHAHAQGVVHRDVKPGNILLTTSGIPRLTDFGIARVGDMEALTRTGVLVGTPAYMAPEQVHGKNVGPPADVYALAAVLYEALAGRPPLELSSGVEAFAKLLSINPAPVTEYQVGIPRALSDLLARCLAKSPDARPDAPAFVALLRDVERRIGASRDPGRVKLLVFAVLCGALGATISLAWLLRGSSQDPGTSQRGRVETKTTRAPPTEAGPERHDVRLEAKVGEKMRISFQVKRDAPLEKSRILVRLAGRVRAVEDDWIRVPGRIEAMKINIALGDQARIHFDSAQSPSKDLSSTRGLRGLIGVEAHFSIHRQTGEYQVRGYDEKAAKVLETLPLTFEDLKRTLRQAFVQNGINVCRRVYPGRPVAVGEEWVVPFQIWFAKRRAKGHRRCVLERGDGEALKIRVVGLEPDFTWDRVPEGLTRATLEGETRLDREESWVELSFYRGKHRFRTRWTWSRGS